MRTYSNCALASVRIRASCLLALCSTIALSLPACSGSVTDTPALGGAVLIRISTTGVDIDPDGYLLIIEGLSDQTVRVAANSVTTYSGAPGQASLELADVAENCVVEGDNPRVIVVAAGEGVETTFHIMCLALG